MKLLRIGLCALVAAGLSACGPEVLNHAHPPPPAPPEPEVKPAAVIDAFSASPTVIKKGEEAKLSWATTNAIAIALKDKSGAGVKGVDSATLAGEATVKPEETTTYLLHATGEGGSAFAIAQVSVSDEIIEIPEAPLLLGAMPETIDAGQKAVLVFSGPEKVVITGANGATVPTNDARAGSVEVSPAVTTTYTATSGKQTATAEIKVRPAIGRFWATPAGAAAGQKLTLHWITAGATEVKVSERLRGELFTVPTAQLNEGAFEDTLPADLPNGSILQYALTVRNAAGLKTANLEVVVSNVPTITEFKAQPALTAGGTVRPKLEWKTTGAQRVRILSGPTGTTPNQLEYVAPNTAVSSGSVELPLPTASTDYELIADSELGGQASSVITVKIVAKPEILTLSATPPVISRPGDLSKIAWTTAGGNRVVLTPIGGSSVFVSTTDVATGSFDVTAANNTEYELVLTNEAGDQEKKRVALNVTGPIGFTFDPPLAVPGQQVTMEWDFGSATGVYGAPVGETRKGPEPFVDISTSPGATELKDLYVTSSTAKSQKLVFPDGFRFHHFGSMYGEAQVTNRGWLSFDETASGSTITATIPSAAQPNNFIAAWASDALRGGKVFWELKGTAPNRELIIQWNEFANATTNSKLTFEVILHENGQVDMLYKEMVATSTTVTIGMESADGRLGYASTFTAAPASGDSVTFNGAGPKTGTVSFAAPGSTSRYQMVVDLGTAKVPVSATLPVIQPGSVRISEVMYKPVGAATAGQWVELHNKSGAALDLRHFTLKTDAGSQPLPTHSLADGAFVVIGQSSDTAANGGTPVNVALPALSLGAATDTVQLLLGTAIISSTSYDDAALAVAAGTSIGANPGFIPAFCISAATYGSAGSKGTPGAQGADCGGYNVSKIPGAYTAVTNSTGTLLLEDEQSVRVAYTFPSGFKFPFDGADRTQVLVGIGYLSFDLAKGATTADTYDAAPSSMTDPNGIKGVIAPMWQRFGYNENFYSRVHTRLVSNPDGNPATADSYLVFQWSGHTPAGNSYGYVNFQAWLFENGNVEFHYGDLYEDSDYDFWTGDYFFYGLVDGSDAAIGISSMSNAGAVVFGYKQPVLTHKMGVRFAKY